MLHIFLRGAVGFVLTFLLVLCIHLHIEFKIFVTDESFVKLNCFHGMHKGRIGNLFLGGPGVNLVKGCTDSFGNFLPENHMLGSDSSFIKLKIEVFEL